MKMEKTILVVDDEPGIIKMVTSRLQRAGYAVLVAMNGNDAMMLAEQQQPDLILMDIMMPEPDGIAVTRMLKAHERCRFIPVILLTARSRQEEIAMALESGADDYIIKPYEVEDLLDKVAQGLIKRR